MQKTIPTLLFLLVISGVLFTGCRTKEDDEDVKTEEPAAVEDEVETEAQDATEVNTESELEAEETSEETEQVAGDSEFEDGTYTETGTYASPAGPESIHVTLTVEDDAVTNVSITKNAVNPTSQQYQGLFTDGISSLVVGKKLEDIGNFSSVNGSSLTPKGFAEALEAIKSAATNS